MLQLLGNALHTMMIIITASLDLLFFPQRFHAIIPGIFYNDGTVQYVVL